MGGGIAQVAAQISKKKVILVDLNQSAVDKALTFMGACLFNRKLRNASLAD